MKKFLKNFKHAWHVKQDRLFMQSVTNLRNLSNRTPDEQIRWFKLASHNNRIKALEKGCLTREVLNKLWEPYWFIVSPYLVDPKFKEHFKNLLDESNKQPLEDYLKEHFLKDENMALMIKHINTMYEAHAPSQHVEWLKAQLEFCMKRDGVGEMSKAAIKACTDWSADIIKCPQIPFQEVEDKNEIDCVKSQKFEMPMSFKDRLISKMQAVLIIDDLNLREAYESLLNRLKIQKFF